MIQFPEDLVLENERVLLRPLQEDDLGISFAFCITGTRYLDYSRWQCCRRNRYVSLYGICSRAKQN